MAGLAAIALAAFCVRLLRLDFVNFHSDEAYFIQLAYQGAFLQSLAHGEPHPPLFLAMLQAWLGIAGLTPYAIRLLPALYATLLVPLVYQLGRLAGVRRAGLAAAFVVAFNPAFLFYATEVRNNGLMAVTGALSFVMLGLALKRPRLLPCYVTAALAALFSHYYTIALVALQVVVGAAWLARRRRLRVWPWAAAPAALLLGFVPWLLYARSTIANYDVGQGTPRRFGEAVVDTWQAFNFGFSLPVSGPWLAAAAGALALAGLAGLWIARRRALLFAAAYALAPVLFGAATLLHQTNFNPRYLFGGAPAYALVVGAGLALCWRIHWALGAVAGAFLLTVSAMAVRNVDFRPEFQPNGYRELTAFLDVRAAPEDTVVLDGVSQWPLYWYYGQLRRGISQPVEFLPRGGDEATGQAVNEFLARGGVWYVESDLLRYDPTHETERLLAAAGYQSLDVHFGGQRLEYFGGRALGPPRPAGQSVNGLTLVAATAAQQPVSAGRPLGVELDWQRQPGSRPVPFKLSLRLEDEAGGVVAQNDTLPLGGYLEVSTWPPGQVVRERAGLIVPLGLEPGAYRLRGVVYDAVSGQALGSPLDFGLVTVDHAARQDPAAAGLPPVGRRIGSLELAAASVPRGEVTPGDTLPVTLLWSVEGATDSRPAVTLAVGGSQVRHEVGGDRYPPARWQAPDVIREVVALRIPPSLEAGEYPVTVDGLPVGRASVKALARSFSPPPVTHSLRARFGEVAELLGYDVQSPSNQLRLRLVWRALAETPTNYSVFVHALGADGRIAGQVDAALDTQRWVAGQVTVVDYTLALAQPMADVALEVGLYEPSTGGRLPLEGARGDSVMLGPVQ